MLINRIYLRNYRVYEEELDLDLPPGLVGVYGPNGAGKSTLLEAILWVLWGRTRTAKEEIRSAGSHGECVAEVTFEHEGHVYVVRRTISGAASMVRAQAQCDGLAMAEGVRETARYVHSVLGMDDAAFRASVFAEQKQMAAFSSQGPAERRKLVLALLGVTPLDAARDRARADARQASTEHDHLRSMLPDLGALQVSAADADAKASACELAAADEEKAAEAARSALAGLQSAFARLDQLRQEHEKLVVEGKAARAELDAITKQVQSLTAELADLAGAEGTLQELEPEAAKLPGAEQRARLLGALLSAVTELAGHPDLPSPPPPDEGALEQASQAVMAARSALGSAQAKRDLAASQLDRARRALDQSSLLSAQQACPLCGQALGEAFAQVQAHRGQELAAAEVAVAEAAKELSEASEQARGEARRLQEVTASLEAARAAFSAWERSASLRQMAAKRVSAAMDDLAALGGSLVERIGPVPTLSRVAGAVDEVGSELSAAQSAAQQCNRLRGRLERRPQAELALAEAEARLASAAAGVEALRDKVRALAFDPSALAEADRQLRQAETAAQQAEAAARTARLAATAARTAAQGEAKRAADAQHQHDQLAELQSQAVHLSRAAELLNGFRNTVVASVGPRLAVQAADLFAELTDREYDRLEVDPETYGLQICDGGISYDLQRFSGSEVDLANLAMRVAISEHVRLLSGGTVGLLVLDEVFGPLDEERRARMLLALERLRARFRQILVVTHSTEIKDQLPNAIEVVKKPGRRAIARVIEN